MILKKWEELPQSLQTPEVRKYYDIPDGKRGQLALKRVFDVSASALLLIACSPAFALPNETRRAMGESGREYMKKNFSRSIVIDAYLEEIKIILKG